MGDNAVELRRRVDGESTWPGAKTSLAEDGHFGDKGSPDLYGRDMFSCQPINDINHSDLIRSIGTQAIEGREIIGK
jgi:hypothetical protein